MDNKHWDLSDYPDEQQAVSNPLERVVMWIGIDDTLPDEPKKHDQKWVDVWIGDERKVDVNFFGGKFHAVIEDYQGDFSHHEEIKNVTHWMVVNSPPS